MVSGPAMIRDEESMLSGYVYVDMTGRDVGGYVEDLKQAVQEKIQLPTGYTIAWSGQYEFMQRVKERLKLAVPLTVAIIFVLYYFTFRSTDETFIVMLGLPMSLVGAVWLMFLLDYNLSIAVWVGILTVIGTAAETSAVMLAYLDEACRRRQIAGGLRTLDDLIETVHTGALERIRPMAMIGMVDVIGLLPVMWASGTGADVMKRLAAPQIGGVFSAMLLTLFVIPAVYVIWRWHKDIKFVSTASRSSQQESHYP
jgi:Cu(I)/Ag(I) efflux system membrane protein CusA/SilA